jgi:hypothetical protein
MSLFTSQLHFSANIGPHILLHQVTGRLIPLKTSWLGWSALFDEGSRRRPSTFLVKSDTGGSRFIGGLDLCIARPLCQTKNPLVSSSPVSGGGPVFEGVLGW